MEKRYIGTGLFILGFLLAEFVPLSGLSTANIAILFGFGGMAWLGLSMFSPIPNPSGAQFKMWKMIVNGGFGLLTLLGVLIIGTTNTDIRVKKELNEYGVLANAVVVDRDYTTLPAKWGKVNYVYFLTVEFIDQNGVAQQVKCEVGEYEYKNEGSGVPIKINYSSRDRNINKLIFR